MKNKVTFLFLILNLSVVSSYAQVNLFKDTLNLVGIDALTGIGERYISIKPNVDISITPNRDIVRIYGCVGIGLPTPAKKLSIVKVYRDSILIYREEYIHITTEKHINHEQ